MRLSPVTRLALVCLLLALHAPVRAARAGGVGLSEPKDSVDNYFPLDPGFRVAQPAYPDAERDHLDTYLYAPSFEGYSPCATYHGDGSDGSHNTANYGKFPSDYASLALEDSPTGRAEDPLTQNSIQLPGRLPSQLGGTAGAYWSSPAGRANRILLHEAQHALNHGSRLHMFIQQTE